ncbi:MAG TPA: galactokinase family protein, partial [Thermomicrobiales bacterium]|nr:galactokinase family protein [Thermomicrobiales bacterium]
MVDGDTVHSDAQRRALDAGRSAFGAEWRPDRIAIAPGRLELLGNHIDYNGGPVLAAAIDRFVVVTAENGSQDRDGLNVVMADVADGGAARIQPSSLVEWRNDSPPPASLDYVRGVIAAALARPGVQLAVPARVSVDGDV